MNKKYYSCVSYKYPFDIDKKHIEGVIYGGRYNHTLCNDILTDFCTACKNRFICAVMQNSKDADYDQIELCLRLNKFYYDKEREKFVLHIFKLTNTNDDDQYESLIYNNPRDYKRFCNELAHAAIAYFERLNSISNSKII